ncbi:hypothetical protein Tco_1231975 [Tanacetum coccineum]
MTRPLNSSVMVGALCPGSSQAMVVRGHGTAVTSQRVRLQFVDLPSELDHCTGELSESYTVSESTVSASCRFVQMANLSEDIQCAGSDTRPPMLDRTDFASWQQRIRLYCWGKENGVNILKSIDEGPFQMGTFGNTN